MTQNEFLVSIDDKENQINDHTMNFKEHDYKKLMRILEVACKSIEVIPEIVFEKIELLDDEYENEKMIRIIPIEHSRTIKVKIHFKLINEDGTTKIDENSGKEIRPTISLLLPRLMNGAFQLYDVSYYLMLQILDYKSLVKYDSISIKTMINSVRMNIHRSKATKRKTNKPSTRVELELFKRKDVPLWLVLFCMYQPKEALIRMLETDKFHVEEDDGSIEDIDSCENIIRFGNKLLIFDDYENDIVNSKSKEYRNIQVMYQSLRYFVIDKNIKDLLPKLMNKYDFLESSDLYIEIIGSYYTYNANRHAQKGASVLRSLQRLLDDVTKEYMQVNDELEMYQKELNKIHDFNEAYDSGNHELIEDNNPNNLLKKRVRLAEYVVYPFIKKLSDNLHSVLNGNNKDTIRINKILNIFKINQNIIIKSLMTNNLVRYADQCNLMSAIWKSKASFVSTEASSDNVADRLRAVSMTGIGIIDPITTPSGSSCGLTFNVTVTNKNVFDLNGRILKYEIPNKKKSK